MSRKIFVNLPVKDLARSRRFYEAIGFTINEAFSDETAACAVLTEDIYVMLLTHGKMAAFTPLPIGDAAREAQHLLALSLEDRAEVDALMEAGIAAGGTEHRDPQDHGFMYSRALADPDGHVWEPFWMDPAAATGGPPTE